MWTTSFSNYAFEFFNTKKIEINAWKCNRVLLSDKCQMSDVIMIEQS